MNQQLNDALFAAWEYIWPEGEDLGDMFGDPHPNLAQQIADSIRGAMTEAERMSAAASALDYLADRGEEKITAALREVLAEKAIAELIEQERIAA